MKSFNSFLNHVLWWRISKQINERLDKIMSAITDFKAAIVPIITQAGNDITQLVTDITNQQTSITALNTQIAALQASIGTGILSAEDTQALADVITAGQALQTSADAAVTNAQSVTTPSVPPIPTT